ncbi:hypothetical protein EYC84_003531 [Monilinia fructicola]|uniref:Uncharacterized protein n=1 Tax=Monilinia fructicola TaxID=38448 RepID=A0A5M9JYM1_MONFR|nr:hypothetical protein EYC84_003531 [Monilinia fructicola]
MLSLVLVLFHLPRIQKLHYQQNDADAAEIGRMLTFWGFFYISIRLWLAGLLNRYFPALHVFRYDCIGILLIYPGTEVSKYPGTPFTTLLPHPSNFIVLCILSVTKGCISDFGFASGTELIAKTCTDHSGRGRLMVE